MVGGTLYSSAGQCSVFLSLSHTDTIQATVHKSAKKHLYPDRSLSKQHPDSIKAVCDEVSRFAAAMRCSDAEISGQVISTFAFLRMYTDDWVLHEYLRLYLKNSVQRAKASKSKVCLTCNTMRQYEATECISFPRKDLLYSWIRAVAE